MWWLIWLAAADLLGVLEFVTLTLVFGLLAGAALMAGAAAAGARGRGGAGCRDGQGRCGRGEGDAAQPPQQFPG